ncbi:hypothetical protein BaRGS_00032110 [Batillaria attramentaria]|uniref:Secreted protein n=1 Tax=Batillaria attramentaria TaxID=370345 RepID=A0ABD0JPJ7_9CAEN
MFFSSRCFLSWFSFKSPATDVTKRLTQRRRKHQHCGKQREKKSLRQLRFVENFVLKHRQQPAKGLNQNVVTKASDGNQYDETEA